MDMECPLAVEVKVEEEEEAEGLVEAEASERVKVDVEGEWAADSQLVREDTAYVQTAATPHLTWLEPLVFDRFVQDAEAE